MLRSRYVNPKGETPQASHDGPMSDAPAPVLIVSGPSGAGKTKVGRLVADAFDLSAHVQADHFTPFVVNGWVQPSLPGTPPQNDVVGGAVAGAALAFAEGGYTVVLDGYIFPDGLEALGPWSKRRGIPLHYAVLRPDLATCLTRVRQRRPVDPEDDESFAGLHARFADLGERETNVVEATGRPEEIAAALLAALSSGQLRVG